MMWPSTCPCLTSIRVTDNDQLVVTHTIGFTVDLPILRDTAQNSGGEYFLADDVESLTKTLLDIIANINDRSLSFSAPAVSVNTFNRTQNLNDLYITMFGAKAKAHWPGNLKKYRIVDGEIVDALGNPAVDPATGFFYSTARSFWTVAVPTAMTFASAVQHCSCRTRWFAMSTPTTVR